MRESRSTPVFLRSLTGYLHIGHAKAISINFGTAKKYNGICNLRFDDTNPTKEDVEYVESIMEDIRWLGYQWDNVYYASDYFPFIHACAVKLIEKGKAYVCDLTADEIREYRGTLTEPGKESPYRSRSVEENLDLFARMTAGEFETGAKVLRAKIDMASPNLNMRDPIITGCSRPPTTAPGISGASIPCTILRIPCPTRRRKSPIPCARWNLRITGRFMTGCFGKWESSSRPGRSSLPA